MEAGLAICCLCGSNMPHNPSGMCLNCLKSRVDITQEIQKECTVHFCRNCGRYLRPPWMHIELESQDMLQLCLKKIKGLNKVKLIDANFLYTEPHSRRLRLKLAVQKEVHRDTTLEQTFLVEFIVQNLQCDDCQRSFTPHTWIAKVQARQRVTHQRTFYYLEQLLLKHGLNNKVTAVKQIDKGLDFEFFNKSHAGRFIDFLHSYIPIQVKQSKFLVSHDASNNTYKYKYTYLAEIAQICKDDLLVLPKEHNAGGVGPLVLCYKVTNIIHVINPYTMRRMDIPNEKFWKHPFTAFASSSQLSEFIVLDIEEERNYGKNTESMEVETTSNSNISFNKYINRKFKQIEVEVARADRVGVPGNSFHVKTHLGHILRVGDSVLGYDLQAMVSNSAEQDSLPRDFPDVLLVKKIYPDLNKPNRKRLFKLNRMNIEAEKEPNHEEYEEFLNEVEADPEIRANIVLYKNEAANPEEAKIDDDTFPTVQLEELISHLTIHDKAEENEEEDEDED
ncbi:unnamed protein product [Blepharisma stoltei]|uniref:60S ribosomal export protein NMD3 n=1 Tax=Blepharisma stoltei TaxID=1481888 RepID=A0AAU9IUY6_9CILI|nr:unnamed protein product [Blepharisma stoltei]